MNDALLSVTIPYHIRKPLIIATAGLVLALLAFLLLPSRSPTQWDHSPQAQIIDIAPFALELDYNTLPHVRVWGDGRILWVTFDQQHHRAVFEGYLLPAQMQAIIERLLINDLVRHSSGLRSDMRGNVALSINLDQQRSYQLYDTTSLSAEQLATLAFLRSGAGASGHPYIPTSGKLVAYPSRDAGYDGTTSYIEWPDRQFGYGLATLQQQPRTLKQEELQWIWEQINTARAPLARSYGQVYWIAVLIPDVSLVQ